MNETDPLSYDDNEDDEMTPEEAIEMLMEEGYTREQAIRMVGLYDPDEYEPAHASDYPDEWYGDIADLVDPEDFE